MGADIYLESEYDAQHEKWQPIFQAAVAKRDALPRDSAEHRAVQEQEVKPAYEAMYEKGYFRDSYNDSSLSSQLRFSWWRDVVPVLVDGYLPIPETRKLRALIDSAELDDARIMTVVGGPEETFDEVKAYFVQKKADLLALLDKSIELNEPLRCSL